LVFIQVFSIEFQSKALDERRRLSSPRRAKDNNPAIEGQSEYFILKLIQKRLIAQTHLFDDGSPKPFHHIAPSPLLFEKPFEEIEVLFFSARTQQGPQRNDGQRSVRATLDDCIDRVPLTGRLRRLEKGALEYFEGTNTAGRLDLVILPNWNCSQTSER